MFVKSAVFIDSAMFINSAFFINSARGASPEESAGTDAEQKMWVFVGARRTRNALCQRGPRDFGGRRSRTKLPPRFRRGICRIGCSQSSV
jgi:hypothetical protein